MRGREDSFWTSSSHVYSSQGLLDDLLISSSELESLLSNATPKPGFSVCLSGLYQPSTSSGWKWICSSSEIVPVNVANVMLELSSSTVIYDLRECSRSLDPTRSNLPSKSWLGLQTWRYNWWGSPVAASFSIVTRALHSLICPLHSNFSPGAITCIPSVFPEPGAISVRSELGWRDSTAGNPVRHGAVVVWAAL